jgi:DNA-binding transcriptional LysR family regulator
MELRHLRYFIAVAEEENVSRAALKLHVSQPALSRQIHDLEDELGFALLERTAKSVRLTQAGRAFLEEARSVIQLSQQAVRNARAVATGEHGKLSVGYAPSLTAIILPRALRAFQAEAPQARVVLQDLSTQEMLAGVREGELDVALLARPAPAALRGLEFEEIASYPMCVAAPPEHPLTEHSTVLLKEAASYPLVGYNREDYPEYQQHLEELFASQRLKFRVADEEESVTSLIAAVEAGRGIALVPNCLVCLVGPRLKIVPLKDAKREVAVGAANRKGASAWAKRFVHGAKG